MNKDENSNFVCGEKQFEFPDFPYIHTVELCNKMCIYINVIRRWWTRIREARPPSSSDCYRGSQSAPTQRRDPSLLRMRAKIHCDEKCILKTPHLFLSLDVKEERKSYRSCRLHHFSAGGVYLIQTLCLLHLSGYCCWHKVYEPRD